MSGNAVWAHVVVGGTPGNTAQISRKRRMHALIASNPRAVIESWPQELFTADRYPETVTTAARTIRSGAGM